MPFYIPSTSIRLLSSATAAGVASVDFTGIDGTYEHFIIEIANAVPSVNNDTLLLRTSSDGGATWASTAGDYHEHTMITASAYGVGVTGVRLTGSGIVNNAASGGGVSALVHLMDPANTTKNKHILFEGLMSDSAPTVSQIVGGAMRLSVSAINAVRLLFAGGNISSGKFKLYGVTRT